MKPNIQTKSKNKIFIIWGLFITGVIIIFLIILLLALNKPQSKTDNQNQPNLNSKTNSQQEQETYNKIMSKIEKEIDKLTQQQQTPSLKYPPKIIYQKDGKTPFEYQIYDLEGNLIKSNIYDKNGNIVVIDEYQKGFLKKSTFLNPDGTVKDVLNH